MGKTFYKNQKKYDDDFSGKRSGKNKGGLKTLNSYVDDLDDDFFDDEIELDDDIQIQHDKNTNNTP